MPKNTLFMTRDLAEHPVDVVIFGEVVLAVRQHGARTGMKQRVVAEFVTGALDLAPAKHVGRA